MPEEDISEEPSLLGEGITRSKSDNGTDDIPSMKRSARPCHSADTKAEDDS
jgi:hypothetical protein